MNKKTKYYQQGDVLIIPVSELPQNNLNKTNNHVLQHGEHTGHSHKLRGIPGSAFEVFEFRHSEGSSTTTEKFIKLNDIVALHHEEHKEINLPPGLYKIGIVKEFSYEEMEARNVVD